MYAEAKRCMSMRLPATLINDSTHIEQAQNSLAKLTVVLVTEAAGTLLRTASDLAENRYRAKPPENPTNIVLSGYKST